MTRFVMKLLYLVGVALNILEAHFLLLMALGTEQEDAAVEVRYAHSLIHLALTNEDLEINSTNTLVILTGAALVRVRGVRPNS